MGEPIMHIAIDCRKIGDYGIGTYIQGLLGSLLEIPGEEHYSLLLPRSRRALVPRSDRVTLVDCELPGYSLRELVALGKILESLDPGLVHFPHYVVPFTQRRTVVTIHDLIHLQAPRRDLPRGGKLYARWMIRRAVRRASAILTVSRTVRDQIAAFAPECGGKIRVTPNGVGPRWFDKPPHTTVLTDLGLTDHEYFLYVGNDKPHKNLDRLVEAFEIARPRLGDARLVLAGTNIPRLTHREGLITTGFVAIHDLRALMGGALALVQPSRIEGFGLPVLEAMASGTPTIVSDIDVFREVAGDPAFFVDPGSASSIAEGMVRMHEDRELREQLSERGVERAREFTWRNCAEKTLEVYRNVGGEGR